MSDIPVEVSEMSVMTVLVIDLVLGHGWPSGSVLPGIAMVLSAMLVIQRSEGRAAGSHERLPR